MSTLIMRPGDMGPGGGGNNPSPFDDSAGAAASCLEIVRLPVSNFMPDRGEEVRRAAYVAIPAVGASAVVVQFKVPEGRNGMINALSNVFVGGGFSVGPGGIAWRTFP